MPISEILETPQFFCSCTCSVVYSVQCTVCRVTRLRSWHCVLVKFHCGKTIVAVADGLFQWMDKADSPAVSVSVYRKVESTTDQP